MSVTPVLLDADFCNTLTPGNDKIKEKEFIRYIFNSLNKIPFIHTYVFENELLINEAIKDLVNEKYIVIKEYADVVTSCYAKKQYVDEFIDLYFFLNFEEIVSDFNVITTHKSGKNMGEIHSLIFAHYLNIPVFMSNDKGARELTKSKINNSSFSIEVKDVCDVFCDIKNMKRGSLDKEIKKTMRAIMKQRTEWKNKYKQC